MVVALFQNGKGWGWLKRSTKHETITNIKLMFVDASSDVLGMNLVLGLWRSRVFFFYLAWLLFFVLMYYIYIGSQVVGWAGNIYIRICGQGQMVMIYISSSKLRATCRDK